MNKSIYISIISLILAVACTGQPARLTDEELIARDGFISRTSGELKKFVEDTSVVWLDVRSKWEYAEGFIGQAVNANVESNYFNYQANHLPKDKTVIVYCTSGARSAYASKKLKEMGFTNIINMADGMVGWLRMGYGYNK